MDVPPTLSSHCSFWESAWFGSMVLGSRVTSTHTSCYLLQALYTAGRGLKRKGKPKSSTYLTKIWSHSCSDGWTWVEYSCDLSLASSTWEVHSHLGVWTFLTISLYRCWLPRCISVLWGWILDASVLMRGLSTWEEGGSLAVIVILPSVKKISWSLLW